MQRLCLLLAACLLLLSVEGQDFSQYQRKTFVRDGQTLPYRILYPKGYQKDTKYPLVLFLHGSGERGNDNNAQLLHGGFLFLVDSIRNRYPAIVIFPQCPTDSSWSYIEYKYDAATRNRILTAPYQQEPTEPARLVK